MARLNFKFWGREEGQIELCEEQRAFSIWHPFLSRVWALRDPNSPGGLTEVATAKQVGMIGRPMIITFNNEGYELLPLSSFKENYVLRKKAANGEEKEKPKKDAEVGVDDVVAVIKCAGRLKAKYNLTFDENLAWELRVFTHWLCIMYLRRTSSNGAAAGAGAY